MKELAKSIMKSIVDFMECFPCGTGFQNSFPEPVTVKC